MDRAFADYEYINDSIPSVGLSGPPRSQNLGYSNCSVVWRSHEAVGPVYMYLHTRTHIKERHRLFEKSRGSSQHC